MAQDTHEPACFSYGNDLTVVKETLECFNSPRPSMRGYNRPSGAFSDIKGSYGI